MRKRNRSVLLRLTDDEYNLLSAKIDTSGQTIQSYILNAALNGKISSADEVEELKKKNRLLADMDKQLRGMGTNLNQIAHVANGQGEIPTAEELTRISDDVSQIKSEVNKEWQLTRRSISQQKLTGQ